MMPTTALPCHPGYLKVLTPALGEGSGSDRPLESHAGPLEVLVPKAGDWMNSNDRRHRMAQANLTKVWRAAGKAACKGLEPVSGKVHMTATIHKDRDGRWDPNNLWPTVKAIVDGMVEAGMLVDDDHKHLVGPDMRRGEKGEPRIVLHMHQASGACDGT